MLETFLINNITFTRMNTMKKKMAQIQKTKNFYQKKFGLTDEYYFESEKEQQASKKSDKK